MSNIYKIPNISLSIEDEDILYPSDSENEKNNNSFFLEIFRSPIFDLAYEDIFFYEKNKGSKEKKLEQKENENNEKRTNSRFTVIKEEIKEKKVLKKRGMKKYSKNSKIGKIHKFDANDNILRKIHCHFLSFIVLFLNDILNHLNYTQRFIDLNYIFKKKASKKDIEEIKKKSIEEIICTEINRKYKKIDKSYNKLICEQIKDNIALKNILSESYLNIFKKIYHRGNKIINLKEYGLNKKIVLSDTVKMYKDLLLKDEKKDLSHSCRRKYNKCIILNFIKDSIFIEN